MSNVEVRHSKYAKRELLVNAILAGIGGVSLLILCAWKFFMGREEFELAYILLLPATVVVLSFSVHFFMTYKKRKLRESKKQQELSNIRSQD